MFSKRINHLLGESEGELDEEPRRIPDRQLAVLLSLVQLNHLSLEYHDATDPGVLVDLDDAVWPLWIQCLEILTAPLDDKLLEGGFRRVFNHDDHIFSIDRIDMGVDEDQVAIVELGFHADAEHAQDIGVLAAINRTGK